jgi:hypothetical protein
MLAETITYQLVINIDMSSRKKLGFFLEAVLCWTINLEDIPVVNITELTPTSIKDQP